jgi:antitoxin HicB
VASVAHSYPLKMATSVRRALDDYLALPYRISLSREEADGEWIGQVEELPGCTARGETPERAARAVRSAMRTWIEEALAEGREVPEPRANGHSGRLLLRMPNSLHAELARRADQEGVSLNQFLVGALSGAVGWMRDGDVAASPRRTEGATDPDQAPPSRVANLAIVANLVVVGVAGIAAVILLVVAWRGGW